MGSSFYSHSLRIKFEPSEGSMLIGLSTIVSLELIQNLQNAKSKDCLFGILNETLTPMGSRFLRSNILQPSTDITKLNDRYDALGELTLKEAMFSGVRQGALGIWHYCSIFWSVALKNYVDTDRVLATVSQASSHRAKGRILTSIQLVIMRTKGNIQQTEQAINQVVTLKTFVDSIKPVWQALTGAASEELRKIRQVCPNGPPVTPI
jgi:DNA mismatch repair protein MSH4